MSGDRRVDSIGRNLNGLFGKVPLTRITVVHSAGTFFLGVLASNVEDDSREETRSILPPIYRSQAKIVKLNKFTVEEVDRLLQLHKD